MKRLVVVLLVFIVTGQLMNGCSGNHSCRWNGFGGCQCNILGACDIHGNPNPDLDIKTLKGYAPSGLEIFSTGDGQNQNLAYLCEGNTVAILYDCNKRIPLYAATVMTGDQLNAGYSRPPNDFTQSNDRLLDPQYQQNKNDYYPAKREICYHTKATGLLIDYRWYNILNPGKTIAPTFANCHQIVGKKQVAVHKGHLIAAGYGRGNPARAAATFTFTNVVPQFGTFNMGKWRTAEKWLVKWGQNHCATSITRNVRMYIIVGAIPSTFEIRDAAIPRYFGSGGFSDYVYDGSYRINVPSVLWSVACCTFQRQDASGNWVDGARHTAFWRENNSGREYCDRDIDKLFHQYSINFFPAAHSSCTDSKNYISM